MFYSVGNLLSPLYPLINLLQGLFRATDEDEPDEGDQNSDDSGQADELDDDGDPDEEDDSGDDSDDDDSKEDSDEDDSEDESDDEDDPDEDLDQEELNGRHADTAISIKDKQVESSLMSLVKTMVKYPDTAGDTIADLQSEQPDLAKRLAKMYEGQKNDALKAALKDAPDGVRDLLSQLVDDVGSLKAKTDKDAVREERRMYKGWERGKHPYLDPKSEVAKTSVGKKLVKEFRAALNRMPANEELSEDMLEDALAIAKRRTGWKNSRVSEEAKRQAKEQAQKARSGAAASGKGKKGKDGEGKREPSSITKSFDQKNDADRQKKVDEVKKKRFPQLYK